MCRKYSFSLELDVFGGFDSPVQEGRMLPSTHLFSIANARNKPSMSTGSSKGEQSSVDLKTSAVVFVHDGGRLLSSLTSGLCWLAPPARGRAGTVS